MSLPTPQEIVKLLITAGLTQSDIHTRTGISQPSISRILSGRNSDPRVSVVSSLERLYAEVCSSNDDKA